MTDKQVIRAFKGCKYSMLECTDCPYGNNMNCERDLDKDVVTLLERQRSEIDKLKKALETRDEADRIAVEAYEQLLYEVDYQQAEIERLKTENEKAKSDLANCFDKYKKTKIAKYSLKNTIYTARAEAIKEFAKYLKDSVTYIPWCDYRAVQKCIDRAVEIKVGADNG